MASTSETRETDERGYALRELFRLSERHYPFTIPGTLLLGGSFYLLGVAFGSGNEYAFLLSLLSLILLVLLAVDAKIQAFRMGRIKPVWDTTAPLFARMEGQQQLIHTGRIPIHYFFRIHFILTGKLQAGRNASLHVRLEGSSAGGSEIRLPVYFPVSGALPVSGRFFVRDLFGFTRAPVGLSEERNLLVRPPLFAQRADRRYESMVSMEDGSHKQSQEDQQKYYMRQYIAGDRMKDINWKASFRIQELITRISPQSPEQSRILHLELRHYRSTDSDGPESILHLNYLKSWLLSFIHALMRDHPEFRFRIVTGDGIQMVDTAADLDLLSSRLGILTFLPYSRSFADPDPSVKEKFVFTTMFDTALPEWMRSHPGIKFHLFRTVDAGGRKKEGRSVRFLREISPEILPGFWIFRKDPRRPVSSASLQTGGMVTEEILRCRIY